MKLPVIPGPIEAKVVGATAASPVATGIALLLINLIPGLGQAWADIIALVIGALATFVGGYMAQHTPRTEASAK